MIDLELTPGSVDYGDLALSDRDMRMLNGEFGRACQYAMRIVASIGRIQGAAYLIDIGLAHIGGSIYTGEASLRVVQQMAEWGGKVRVPTTLNAISVDRRRWRERNVDPVFASHAEQLADAFVQMGASPIYTCTPYAYPASPQPGQDIVWAESNAIVYANSVLGAHTNRHGDFMDICAAITGRVPYSGFHIPENRIGKLLVEVTDFKNIDSSFYTVLGYLIGKYAELDIPVITGISQKPTLEDMKMMCSTLASSGSVGMFHMVGITPEAPTLSAAMAGYRPKRLLKITKDSMRKTWQGLSTGANDSIDMVAMGSPHFTIGDFRELAPLVAGKRRSASVDFYITTNRLSYSQAEQEGLLEPILGFGAHVYTDTCLCMLNSDMVPNDGGSVMTNSGKFAHYGPGLVDKGVYFGTTRDCVASAVAGRRILEEPDWLRG